jgi:hypothetical protein
MGFGSAGGGIFTKPETEEREFIVKLGERRDSSIAYSRVSSFGLPIAFRMLRGSQR